MAGLLLVALQHCFKVIPAAISPTAAGSICHNYGVHNSSLLITTVKLYWTMKEPPIKNSYCTLPGSNLDVGKHHIQALV